MKMFSGPFLRRGLYNRRPVYVNAIGSIYGGARVAVRGGPRERSKMSFFFTGNLTPEEEEAGFTTPPNKKTETSYREDPFRPYEIYYMENNKDRDALRTHLITQGYIQEELKKLVTGNIETLLNNIISQAIDRENRDRTEANGPQYAPHRHERVPRKGPVRGNELKF